MTFRSWRWQEPLEQEELTDLLPAPGNPVLPADRQHLLEDFLMSTITEDDAGPVAPVEPPRTARSRRMALRIAVPVALVAALGTTFVFHQGASPHQAKAPSKAALLLENAADVVAKGPAVPVRHDQFVYVRNESTGRGNPLQADWVDKQGHEHRQYAKTAGKMTKSESWQEWVPWSHSQTAGQSTGNKPPEPFEFSAPGNGLGGVGAGGLMVPLEDLSALPDDPAKALRTIEADVNRQMANDENTLGGKRPLSVNLPLVFQYLGGMLDESVDPRTTAFLYRVAAQIPGTTVIPDAVDAAGRHGVAISLPGVARDRQEWIFDKSTYAYLGYRDVTLDDTVIGKAGTPFLVTAVLERAVVERVGDTSSTPAR